MDHRSHGSDGITDCKAAVQQQFQYVAVIFIITSHYDG